jgi:tripartite-type tricarboxylate transporter receptor subunit TctC
MNVREVQLKLPRRNFLHLVTGAAALPVVSRIARAEAYPSRPVRLILGYAPGGSPDIVARLIGQWLSERLGQVVVIENRPGAASNIGTEAAVRAAPDGYTLLYVTTANAINATLYDKLNFNFMRDIAPVAGVIRVPNLISTNLSIPAKTISEFISYAKAKPGKLNFGGPPGGTVLLSALLFNVMTGVMLVHVPYTNQTQAISDLLAGQMHVSFDPMPAMMPYATAGKLRALGVTTAMRSPTLPEVPAVGEFVPGYEASSWHGLGVPRNTPADIIETLNKEVAAALADPPFTARFAQLGGVPMPMSPAEFGQFIADETEKWAKVIKSAGLKPD